MTVTAPVVLIGFMAAGKSAVGRLVARDLGRAFLDLDDLVAAQTGLAPPEFIRREGEERFRRAESRALAAALETRRTVIAVGGGAVLAPGNRRRLTRSGARVVWLRVEAAEALRRAQAGSGAARPLLPASERDASRLLAAREPAYAEAATATVVTDGLTPEGVRDEVLRALEAGPGLGAAGPATAGHGAGGNDASGPAVAGRHHPPGGGGDPPLVLDAGPPGHGPVVVGHGLLEQVPALPGFPDDTSGRAFLAGDALALTLHGRTVAGALRGAGLETAVHVLPPGEEGKTPRRLAALWEAMAAAGLTRHDVVVSVGGGAVTDTAGFAAATYMRGVRLVHVPTTLLAQVDAAVGGKTAVNLSAGKNLAGVFHLPSLVVADVATLDTLPPELEAEGLVELVKTLLVGGGPGGDGAPAPDALLDRAPSWPDLVAAAVRIKLGIARDDLRDRGRRMILNLGHTFGHALEAAAGPGRVRHGLAVGVGIAAAVRLSERLGLLSEPSAERASKLVEALLGRFPRSRLRAVAALSPDGVLPYLSLDKKRGSGSGSGGAPVFVLLRDEDDGGVGAVPVTVPVPELRGEIERALVSALSLTRELASDKRRRWRGQGR